MTTTADPDPVATLKSRLRSRIRPSLAALEPGERERGSARIRQRLADSTEFRACQRILGFVALPSEPDLMELLSATAREGRTVLLPRWDPASGGYLPAVLSDDGRLVPGPYRVPEPPPDAATLSHERLDLILVPGIAFDRQGRRLGRGRGFYDRLLARTGNARRWGVAFDLQIVDEVPSEAHDVNLDLIVTPESWWPVPPGDAL